MSDNSSNASVASGRLARDQAATVAERLALSIDNMFVVGTDGNPNRGLALLTYHHGEPELVQRVEGQVSANDWSPDGKLIGRIRLPEVCGNICFGGPKRNRLFMAASQSLYAVYTATQGAGPG